MNRQQTYQCPSCKSTKTIKAHSTQTIEIFKKALPKTVACNTRGCTNRAVPMENNANN